MNKNVIMGWVGIGVFLFGLPIVVGMLMPKPPAPPAPPAQS